ncbi:MAG: hypothetical protein V3U92_06990 [Cellulophaga sp.]
MREINPIYHNHFGVAFQWKKGTVKNHKKVQIVFRDIGLLLTRDELLCFSKCIKDTFEDHFLCEDCSQKEGCRSFLLDTPAHQVSLAVSKKELHAIDDLVEGTIFQLNLNNFLSDIEVGS